MRFAVFASGNGTNLANLIKHVKQGKISAELALVFSDKPEAFALERAKKAKIPTLTLVPKDFPSKDAYETEILKVLCEKGIDLIALAGYMRIVGSVLIQAYPQRILNVHPALLPAFKGAHAIRDAFEYGARVTGVTVHFVDEQIDHGPIILQKEVPILAKDTLESLEKRIHQAEYDIYPKAIELFARGRLKIEGRKVR